MRRQKHVRAPTTRTSFPVLPSISSTAGSVSFGVSGGREAAPRPVEDEHVSLGIHDDPRGLVERYSRR